MTGVIEQLKAVEMKNDETVSINAVRALHDDNQRRFERRWEEKRAEVEIAKADVEEIQAAYDAVVQVNDD